MLSYIHIEQKKHTQNESNKNFLHPHKGKQRLVCEAGQTAALTSQSVISPCLWEINVLMFSKTKGFIL